MTYDFIARDARFDAIPWAHCCHLTSRVENFLVDCVTCVTLVILAAARTKSRKFPLIKFIRSFAFLPFIGTVFIEFHALFIRTKNIDLISLVRSRLSANSTNLRIPCRER